MLNIFDIGPVFASQITKLRKNFTWWNQLLCRSVPTPNSCTKFKIHSAHASSSGVPNLTPSRKNFDIGPVFASQIKKLRKSFTWWNQLLCRSVLTPNSCTKFKIHSAHADSPGIRNPMSSLTNFDTGQVFASQINKLRKSFTWRNQLLCRSVLTPNSCTKFMIHSAHADHPGVPNPIPSLNNFDIGPVFASQINKLRKSFTWWNQLLCRSVLTPNSCTKFKIHSAHADSPGIRFPMSSLTNFDTGPVFASQINKLRKSFTWWNQLLCSSILTPNSCTKFKIHSAHADSPGVPNPIPSLNNFDIGPVFASQINKLRKSFTWWNQLLCRSVLTPNSCTKFKIHSAHADSPGIRNPMSSLTNFDNGQVFASQINKLRKSFTWWNQLLCRSVLTPNSCTKFKIHSAHADSPGIRNPMSSLTNFDNGQVFASQINKLRKSFTWWNQLLCRSVLTPNSCTKFMIHSAHADSPGIRFPMSSLTNFDIGQVFASQINKLRKSFTWWNQLLCRSVLTPNSCTKFKIHSAHADSPGIRFPMSSLTNFDIGPVFASQINKLRKSFTWWNQLLCRSILSPSSCTKFKIHSAHADSPGVPNPIPSLNNFDIGPVFASQINKLRKSFTWWNQLLCRSVLTPNSCTKLRIHSAHADSPGVQKPMFSLNNFDIGQVFASQNKKLRKSFTWWNQVLCRSVLTPNSCTKFKIHSAHADSPGVPNLISSLNNFDIGPVFASQIKKLRKSFT